MSDILDRLSHIQDAIVKIGRYTQRGRQHFDDEEEIQNSVIYNLQIIGEAANSIPLEFRNGHPEIPWRPMINMRNRLIHNYASIDMDIVWETATVNIPELGPSIKALIETIT